MFVLPIYDVCVACLGCLYVFNPNAAMERILDISCHSCQLFCPSTSKMLARFLCLMISRPMELNIYFYVKLHQYSVLYPYVSLINFVITSARCLLGIVREYFRYSFNINLSSALFLLSRFKDDT